VVELLPDENLSPRAAVGLRADGHDVIHLRERGRLGISDPEVLALALVEDRVLVTANVADFRKLAAARDLHAGIVLLLDGALRRDEQLEVVDAHPLRLRLAGTMTLAALGLGHRFGQVCEMPWSGRGWGSKPDQQ
jgi:predicted nuclease of predicted toxin-antitoxin system